MLTNATAIGYNAKVNSSNSLVLGDNANVGIGTSSPSSKLDVSGTTKTTNFQMTNGAASGYVLQSDASGNGSWVDASTLTSSASSKIQDADADTKIETEQSANENQIHFSVNGTEYWKMKPGKIEVSNTGNSIYLGKSAGNGDNLGSNLKNVGIGTEALYSLSSGINNTAIGYNAGLLRNGNYNTMIGTAAGHGLSSNSYSNNTLVGSYAGYNCGANNTMIGADAGQNNTGSGNVFIGNSAGSNASGDNKLFIANSSGTPLIFGNFSSGYVTINSKLGVGANSPINAFDVEGGIAIGSTYSGTSTAPTNGAIIEGNVGIGTSSPQAKLAVNGDVVIDQSGTNTGNLTNGTLRFGGGTSGEAIASCRTSAGNQFGLDFYTNDLIQMSINTEGDVGIGTTMPVNKMDVEGGIAIGSTYAGTSTAPINGAIIQGKVGIGTSSPDTRLHVGTTGVDEPTIIKAESSSANGSWLTLSNSSTGGTNWNFISTGSASSSGAGDFWLRDQSNIRMTVESATGNVGIGTTTPVNKLDIEGGIAIGSTYSGTFTAPTNGAIVEGNVGIGTTSTLNKLDVEGGIAIGSTYSGAYPAPSDGAIIQGKVGIGNETPEFQLDVIGSSNLSVAARSGSASGTSLRIQNSSSGGQLWDLISTGSGNSEGAGNLLFKDDSGVKITLLGTSGNLGIGTTSPTQARLVVDGSESYDLGSYGYLNGNGNTGDANNGAHSYSIYASNRVAASEFNAHSDARIKNIQGQSNSQRDLETLMGIQITDYTLRDTVAKGNQAYKKVIAQQVERVYPQAVNRLTDVVPDIYQLAEIRAGRVALANTLKAGDRVKLIFAGRSELVAVTAADAAGFEVKLPDEGQVFVYGREVSDFRTVDYEALSMLNVSATQELMKIISRQSEAINALKAANASMSNDIQTIKAALGLNPVATEK